MNSPIVTLLLFLCPLLYCVVILYHFATDFSSHDYFMMLHIFMIYDFYDVAYIYLRVR